MAELDSVVGGDALATCLRENNARNRIDSGVDSVHSVVRSAATESSSGIGDISTFCKVSQSNDCEILKALTAYIHSTWVWNYH